jgi:hypothetical protein
MSVAPSYAHFAAHSIGESLKSVTRPLQQASNALMPTELPGMNELFDLYRRGFLSFADLYSAAKLNGVIIDENEFTTGEAAGFPFGFHKGVWYAAYLGGQTLPTFGEYAEIANRRNLPDSQFIAATQMLGFTDPALREAMTNLRYDIPGPSDLVRFSVRHCWEPDLIKQLTYNEEFPGKVIDYWHQCKGLDYPLFTGPFQQDLLAAFNDPFLYEGYVDNYINKVGEEPTWAKFYWYSHWVLPSPGQGYEMMFRLRPDRDPQWDPPEAKGKKFDYRDLELLLRANDYPPKYRPLLAAIAHRMPGVRFIRDFRKQGVYDFRAVLEWALRWGYSEQDALDIASDIERNVLATEEKKTSCKGCATCDQAFEVGILSRQELQDCYTGYGMPEQEAAKAASLAELKLGVKRGREIVTNIRKRFLRGSITADQAGQLLQQWGIKIDRVQNYLADWQMEFEAGRKELSAGQAVKYACQGIISLSDLVNRLTNLGYPLADQEALVSEATFCAANLAQQQLEKLARKDRQAKADAYSAARRARQSLVEAQRYLASHGSPKELQKWFCEGAISDAEVWTRLNAMGWPDVDISRFLSDCKGGKRPTITTVGKVPVVPPLIPPTPEATAIEELP